MRLVIVGAGIAGLIAARVLRRYSPHVIEMAEDLPHNHSAVLRFRSSIVGDVTGIPFKKVSVIRSALPWRNPAADALSYARKVAGHYKSDRSISREQGVVERYIAPADFIERLAEGTLITFGSRYAFAPSPDKDLRVISTIPMPSLMSAIGYPRTDGPSFSWTNGYNIVAKIKNANAYATVYIPDPTYPFSRVTITDDELIVEYSSDKPAGFTPEMVRCQAVIAAGLLGIAEKDVGETELKHQDYAKILPIDEGDRRAFIYWASTLQGRAFSLGRFATWRPGLLADDLVKDIRVIESLMTSTSSGYDAQKIERDRS